MTSQAGKGLGDAESAPGTPGGSGKQDRAGRDLEKPSSPGVLSAGPGASSQQVESGGSREPTRDALLSGAWDGRPVGYTETPPCTCGPRENFPRPGHRS